MLLLDTHALLWFIYNDDRLSSNAVNAIKETEIVYVSIASLWEIAIKQHLGKLEFDGSIKDISDKCMEKDVLILPIKVGYLDRIKTLPDIHKDPFDRLIVAQAMEEDLIIVSKDENIIKYNINTIW